jgi:hypothetical protein
MTVLHQDVSTATPQYMSIADWMSPANSNISDVGEHCKVNGKYHFRLTYPQRSGVNSLEWKQSSNPFVSGSTASGYEDVNVDSSWHSLIPDGRSINWGGLEWNGGTAVADGSIGSWWFMAIGSTSDWYGGIPSNQCCVSSTMAEKESLLEIKGC